jgi:hypothetical protein
MEGPPGGSVVIEITDATAAEIEPFRERLTNWPEWSSRKVRNVTELTLTIPQNLRGFPKAALTLDERENLAAGHTVKSIGEFQVVVDVKDANEFRDEFRDTLRRHIGPRYLFDPLEIDRIALLGEIQKYTKAEFQGHLSDAMA